MKAKYLIGILFLMAVTNSCISEFLDVQPVSDLASETFWKTPDDANNGLNAIYASVALNYGQRSNCDFLMWFEARAANMWHSQRQSEETRNINLNMLHAGLASSSWNGYYKAIGRINYALHYIALADGMAPETKNHFLADASFLRAKMYFDLIRLWGDVPLVIEPTLDPDISKMYVQRKPKAEVMAQILKDIDFAVKNCDPTKNDPYKFTIGAAYALQTQIAMWNKDYQAAFNATTEVIKLNRYTLNNVSNWNNIFQVGNTNENIWTIKWLFSNMGNNRCMDLLGKSSSILCLNKDFVTEWTTKQPKDLRRWLTYDTLAVINWETHLVETNHFRFGPWKFHGVNKPDWKEGQSEKPYIIYRLADLYLLRAEAANQLGNTTEALRMLNLVRARAGLPSITAAHYAGSPDPKKALDDIIFWERQVELVAEGHIWFDLVRTGRANQVLNNTFENYFKVWGQPDFNKFTGNECELLFPINAQVIIESFDNIKQSPCY